MHRYLLLVFVFLFGVDSYANLSSPNISGNALFLYRNSNFAKHDTDVVRNGIDLQEAELAFYSDVDPYSRLNMLLTVHPNYTLDSTAKKVSETWAVEPEELYAESGLVPNFTLKGGKFKAAFGKNNPLHTHAQPFVDAPIANDNLLGTEGLNDVGVSAAYLLPTPWFSEITAQYLRAEDSNAEFNSPSPNDGVGLGHWKNLVDINDDLTAELGGSYVSGRNSLHGTTTLAGADLTFKWRPAEGGRYHSWMLGMEYINRRLEQNDANRPLVLSSTERGNGLSVLGQYQFAERWASLLRYETLNVNNSAPNLNPGALPNALTTKWSGALVFEATEFSAFRFEYNRMHGPTTMDGVSVENKFYVQANFTIGSHPAHSY